jgi:hypothetical protein
MFLRRLIVPFFFEDCVTTKRYRNYILDVFMNQLHDKELTHGYVQQDGAAREGLRYLRLISQDLRQARSLDHPLIFSCILV